MPKNINAKLVVSAAGLLAIQNREGVRKRPYPDTANNCTVGVGQLMHFGPCTAAELNSQVSATQIKNLMADSVQRFSKEVIDGVSDRQLTQNQFDALVIFAYNAPRPIVLNVLRMANTENDAGVVNAISATVFIHPRDALGKAGKPVRSNGLANRRAGEVAQYAATQR